MAVDRLDKIAALEARRSRGTVGFDPSDAGHVLNPAKRHEHAGENHESENEIGDWSGEHDRGAIDKRLTRKRHRPIDRRVGGGRTVDAGDVRVAVELDVPAERQRAHPPARPVRINPGAELRTEAEGESVDPDAAPAPDQIVPELVDKHDGAQDDNERYDVPSQPARETRDRIYERHQKHSAATAGPDSSAARRKMVTEGLPHLTAQAKSRRVFSFAIW